MTTEQSHTKTHDLWLDNQKEAIRALRPNHKVDVVDAVMKSIPDKPLPNYKTAVIGGRRAIHWAAAACVLGIVVTTGLLLRPSSAAAAPVSNELSIRLYDVYEYCNDYADPEYVESAAYYDNPVVDFL
ncbi:MAG: hypothetical protein IIY87_00705 [Bacteroidales bacterium]|jgi:hypothetical protein|nr:hypothetical protein [Bacteroidales bacterium]